MKICETSEPKFKLFGVSVRYNATSNYWKKMCFFYMGRSGIIVIKIWASPLWRL